MPHQGSTGQAVVRPAYRPLVVALVAVAAGIVTDRYLRVSLVVWWSTAVSAWIVWLALWRSEWKRAAAIALCLSLAALAAAWHHQNWRLFDRTEIGLFAGRRARPVCLDVVVREAPRIWPAPAYDPLQTIPQSDRTRVEIDVVSLRDRGAWHDCSGGALLTVDGHLVGVRRGDRLRVFGMLAAPRQVQNPGEFDLANHLRGQRVLAQVAVDHPDCVEVVERADGFSLGQLVDRLRAHGRLMLNRYVGDAESPLATAILLGAREQIDPDRTEAFVQTGTVHVLSISGMHVGILAGALYFFMRLGLVPRRAATWSVALLVVGYTLVVDAQPPVVRATILVVIACMAMHQGRRPLGFNSLAAAALVVLAMNPAELFRVGTQLSFMCVAVLAWFAPPRRFDAPGDALDRLLAESRPPAVRATRCVLRWAVMLTCLGFAVSAVTIPLTMARFHVASPVGVVLNTLLWIPATAALLAGFGVLITGWLVPPVAEFFGWLCSWSLWLLERGVDVGRELPGAYAWTPGPDEWWLLGFYGGLALMAAGLLWPLAHRWKLALLATWCAVGLFTAWARSGPRDELLCTFLSVGHGTAAVLELPDGRTMMYDAGHLGTPTGGGRIVAGYLWSRGITHLDAIVISHADADHYNAVGELVDRFSIGVIYVSPVMFAEGTARRNPGLAALRERIEQAEIPIRVVASPERFVTGEVEMKVIHPPLDGTLPGDNANSLVLAVSFRGQRLLLTGDLESHGLDDVMAAAAWPCDVLAAPHHGSPSSSPPAFARWARPAWVAVSGGARDDLDAVREVYRAVGAVVLHTATDGAIRARFASDGVDVATYGTLGSERHLSSRWIQRERVRHASDAQAAQFR